MRRRATGALFALLIVAATPSAAAHANYLFSEPIQGARLGASPTTVTVTLTQDIDPAGSNLLVLDSIGERVDDGDVQVEAGPQPRLMVGLPSNLTEGAYRVEWKALSKIDHHTTQGSFGFAVGNATPPSAAEQTSNSAPGVGSLVGRTIFFVGFALAGAALLFLVFVSVETQPLWLRRVEPSGWALIVLGSLVLLGEAGARTNTGLADWQASGVLRDLVVRLLVSFLGLAAGLFALRRRSPFTSDGPLGVGLLALAYLSGRSGHASVEGFGAATVDAIHLLATATWIGGLALFTGVLVAQRAGAPDGLMRVGRRFSRVALACVVVMAVTGIVLGILILDWPSLQQPFGWFDGVYGAALGGKIMLATTMVGLAVINRFVFLRRLPQSPLEGFDALRRRFGKFVGAEAIMGFVVVGLAALLTSTSPPYEAPVEPPMEVIGTGAQFEVILRLDAAPRPGTFNDLRFHITWLEDNSTIASDTCGRPRGCIITEVVQPGADEEDEDRSDVHKGGEHRILEPTGDGWWIVKDVLFVEEGHYEFILEIQTEYVFFDTVSVHVPVEPEQPA